MRTEIIAGAAIIAGTIVAVKYFEYTTVRANANAPEMAIAQANIAAAPSSDDYWGEEVRIKAAPDFQYYVNAEVNRRAQRFLIDTGASYVALRDSDARDAGIYTSWTDYKYPVKTANGETKAALVTIDEIEVEGLRVEGVKAFILQDDQLAINLLGMSFLSRLDSVSAKNGELVLRG